MTFRNPYNFIGIAGGIRREKKWLTHEKIQEYSGEILCNIQFKTHFLNKTGDKTIQASTLKGLIRSTAEAISNSCISVISEKYEYPYGISSSYTSATSSVTYQKATNKKGKTVISFAQKSLVGSEAVIDSCDAKSGLCITCRMFGTTVKEEKGTEESFTHGGKVRVYDAQYLGTYGTGGDIKNGGPSIKIKYLKRHSLSNPKNHHESFYLLGKNIRGRKFYYHHEKDGLLEKKENDADSVKLVEKDAVFQFEIAFQSLSDEEYGLLLWTLELEQGLGHKIGMGKPLGLGSCIMTVTHIRELTPDRYRSLTIKKEQVYDTSSGLDVRKKVIKDYWKATPPIPKDLKCILTLNHGLTVRYPVRAKGEFNQPLHDPCGHFGSVAPTSSTSPSPGTPKSSKADDMTHIGKGNQMMEALKKSGLKTSDEK